MSLRKSNFKNFTVSDHAVVMVRGTTKNEAKQVAESGPAWQTAAFAARPGFPAGRRRCEDRQRSNARQNYPDTMILYVRTEA